MSTPGSQVGRVKDGSLRAADDLTGIIANPFASVTYSLNTPSASPPCFSTAASGSGPSSTSGARRLVIEVGFGEMQLQEEPGGPTDAIYVAGAHPPLTRGR